MSFWLDVLRLDGGDKCGNTTTSEDTIPGAQARGDRGLGAAEMEKRQQVGGTVSRKSCLPGLADMRCERRQESRLIPGF